MTIKDALTDASVKRGDAEILLAHVLKRDRTWVLAHESDELTIEQERIFRECLKRRGRGEPVAYIKGEKEFYGKLFTVTSDVLIPRPATEGLVDRALQAIEGTIKRETTPLDEGIVCVVDVWSDVKPTVILDIGTGSGCIAITLARLLPSMKIGASDIDKDALRVAESNMRRHMMEKRIELRQGRGLDPWKDLQEPFLIVSNPPYVPMNETLMQDVADFEPHEALFAGERGTDVILPLLEAARKNSACIGIAMECREDQADIPSQ